MTARPAFRIDPSATASFSAIKDKIPRIDMRIGSGRHVRAVVVGGGTGAPMSIRTLLSLGVETSAVVAMADDGGSTGVLREEADVTPPGDIPKCIAAFARDPNDPLVRAFKYRFAVARDHALGNLMLAALEDACGSFPEAIAICERLLDAQGRVYPSTLDHVTLSARTRDGRSVLDGQAVACHSRTALESVELHGSNGDIEPYEPALEAIRKADLIVLGPGPFHLGGAQHLSARVTEAIAQSRGRVLFVCSLADVQGETWGLPPANTSRRLRSWHGGPRRLRLGSFERPPARGKPRDGSVHREPPVPTSNIPRCRTLTISPSPTRPALLPSAIATCCPYSRADRSSSRVTSPIPGSSDLACPACDARGVSPGHQMSMARRR